MPPLILCKPRVIKRGVVWCTLWRESDLPDRMCQYMTTDQREAFKVAESVGRKWLEQKHAFEVRERAKEPRYCHCPSWPGAHTHGREIYGPTSDDPRIHIPEES